MMDESSTDNGSAIDTLAADIYLHYSVSLRADYLLFHINKPKNWHETIFKSRKYPGTNQ